MDNRSDALDAAYHWLSLRLKRAAYIEGELLSLATKGELSDEERKRYDELSQDNKNVAIKDVVGVIDGLKEEDESIVGFEEFE